MNIKQYWFYKMWIPKDVDLKEVNILMYLPYTNSVYV